MNADPEGFRARFPQVAADLGSDDETRALCAVLVPLEVAAGEAVAEESRFSDAVLLVDAGSFALTLEVDGRTVEIGRIGAGAVVGDADFLDAGPPSATVRALAAGRVLRLDRARFEELRRAHPRAATSVMRALCRSLARRVRLGRERLDALLPGVADSDGAHRPRGDGDAPAEAASHHPPGVLGALRDLLGVGAGDGVGDAGGEG